MGLIPVVDSDVFFVLSLCHVNKLAFHISLPSFKFTIFIHLVGRSTVVSTTANVWKMTRILGIRLMALLRHPPTIFGTCPSI